MNITFVLAVLNKLNLTKECYNRLRIVYPDAKLVISTDGSNDGTKEWLSSLNDENLIWRHGNEKSTFSYTYNKGIELVPTDKLVLIHNDMVIGHGFLESLERLLTEDTLLSYTTIEPPIFAGHERPGKIILDLGSSFDDFNYQSFNNYVNENKDNDIISDGAVFFMSGYKKLFEDVGMFDGFSFFPCFCEDDDFLIRTKLKGYKLKTTSSAITYHFVSQTSRFSDDFKNERLKYEISSNKNFVRKWGIPIQIFKEMKFWENEKFEIKKFSLKLQTNDSDVAINLEPFFDYIQIETIPDDYIKNEQDSTHYDLKSKFTYTGEVNAIVYEISPLTNDDIPNLYKLRLIIPNYEPGTYQIGNMGIIIKKRL